MGVDDLIVNIQTGRRAVRDFRVYTVENGFIVSNTVRHSSGYVERELVASTLVQLLKVIEKLVKEEEKKDVK